MRCARCSRALNTAAVQIGRYTYGPVCALAMGLTDRKRKKAARPVRDARTLDLFGEAA